MIGKFDQFVLHRNWREAVTYREVCPHEYTLKLNKYDAAFYEAVQVLRDIGFWASWKGNTGIYLIRGDHYYWTMGAPLDKTVVINRALLKEYNLMGGEWVWGNEAIR